MRKDSRACNSAMNNIEDCEEYLLNIPKFKKKTLLSDTLKFYEMLGSPGKDIKKIHVAGTNGKGSTCYYTSRILEAHGFKTGLFTSPHLVSMKERFVFGGEMITDEEFVEVFEKVRNQCELFDDEEKITMHPSFFEFLFLMFMEWMDLKKADVIVLETGLGGMLDATNIFEDPSVTVITSVGLDHTKELGSTIESIATQKAGIIKENVPLVIWDNGEEVNNLLKEKAKEKHAEVFMLEEENIGNFVCDEKHIAFSLNTRYDELKLVRNLSVNLPTPALYQRINSSLAVMAAALFLKDDFDADKTLDALSKGYFHGRFEEIARGFFVDGAHNEDAMHKLLESVKTLKGKKVIIFGACKDKDYEKMLHLIDESGSFDTIILTNIDSARAVDSNTMKECTKDFKSDILVTNSLRDAIDISKTFDSAVYIAGSLYLVGEAVSIFKNRQ